MNPVKVVGSARKPILTCCGSWQSSVSLERMLEEVEVGGVFVKEGVQVPGGCVPLIKDAVHDMLRDGVNYFWTTHTASPWT